MMTERQRIPDYIPEGKIPSRPITFEDHMYFPRVKITSKTLEENGMISRICAQVTPVAGIRGCIIVNLEQLLKLQDFDIPIYTVKHDKEGKPIRSKAPINIAEFIEETRNRILERNEEYRQLLDRMKQ